MRKSGVRTKVNTITMQRTKVNTITMQHVQKENRQKPRVSAGFVAGAEGLVSAVASVGPGRSPPGCRPPRHALRRGAAVPRCRVLPRSNEKSQASRKRYLTFLAGAEGLGLRSRSGPRHAVLEWMWESALGERGRGSVARFPTQVRGRTVLVWCYGKFSGPKRAKKSGKSPKKREILLTKTDTVPIL